MKIRKGDQVLIISGKDRGKKGKVLEAFPKENQIMVEGVNLRKKHQKPRKMGEKGQIITLPAPIAVSNVKLICPKCKKPVRVGYQVRERGKAERRVGDETKFQRVTNKEKIRICKKCGETL